MDKGANGAVPRFGALPINSATARCACSRAKQYRLRPGLRLHSMALMRLAVEHVRRMTGGAQSHLMRCDDGGYCIVKFQNNPQHLRVLANEMLATRLAARLGICVPQIEVVEVRPELIAYSADLVIQLGLGRKPCAAGKQFGSQFPGHPARMAVHDFLPDEELVAVRNFSDFLGIFVFDKWTCNTNGRQAIFYCSRGQTRYQALMIDQGFWL